MQQPRLYSVPVDNDDDDDDDAAVTLSTGMQRMIGETHYGWSESVMCPRFEILRVPIGKGA